MVPQLVNIWFQVLFHSPPGVLFTFPSQYYALSVTSVKVPRVSTYSGSRHVSSPFAYGAFTLSGRLSQNRSAKLTESIPRSEPQDARTLVWALPISLAATFGITCCFLFLRLLRCFSSPGSRYGLALGRLRFTQPGFPIRRSPDRWIFAPPRSFSQLITSFFGP